MKYLTKPISILLSIVLIISVFTIIPLTVSAESETFTDILTLDDTGARSTAYVDWTAQKGENHTGIESDAVYAGNSAKGNGGIQMRSKNNNSGVVTTTSGGFLRTLTVEWKDIYNNNNRELKVFGSNIAYSAPSELYNASTQGTLLGTLVFNDADYDFTNEVYCSELTVDSNYKYVGIRSSAGALYLESVCFEWESDAVKPVWSWANDYSSATATFSDGTNDTVVNATVSSKVIKEASYLADGSRVYTASVTYNNSTYTDRQTEIIPKLVFNGSVSYIDENGDPQTASNVSLLTHNPSELNSGWYAAYEDVSIDEDVDINGDVKLILCDGVSVDCRISGFYLSNENDKLTIYGQENNSGKLLANFDPNYPDSSNCRIIYSGTGEQGGYGTVGSLILNGGTIKRESASNCFIAVKNITINGGRVKNSIIDESDSVTINNGDISLSNVTTALKTNRLTINGGNVTATGNNGETMHANEFVFNGGRLEVDGGICADSIAEISWSDSTDSIYAKRYNREQSTGANSSSFISRAVTLKKDFVDENGNEYSAGTYSDANEELGYKTLYPYTNPWEELRTFINNASSGDTITLNKSYKAAATDSVLVIPEGKVLTIDLNGFTIDRGLSGKAATAGGNVITVNGDLTLKDTSRAKTGKITGGNNTQDGGGIIINNCDFVIENCTVTGNTTDGNGGGVWGNGCITVNNASVMGNISGGNGGGICFNSNNSSNKLKVSGKPDITGNKKSDGSENNVYLTSQISVYPQNNSASLTSDAKIGISVPSNTDQRTITDSSLRNKCSQSNFSSDSEQYIITENVNGDIRIKQSYVFRFDPNGGTGTMPNIVVYNPVVTLPECAFTAPEGKRFKAWSDGITSTEYPVDEELEIASGVHEFTISPIWADLHTVTIKKPRHGAVTASKSVAVQGEKVNLSIIPDEDYVIESVTVNNTTLTPVNGVYSFRMPEENVTVKAKFASPKPNYYSDIAVFCALGTNNDGWDANAALADDNDYTIAVEDLNSKTDPSPVIALGYRTTIDRNEAIKDIILRVSSSNDSPESLSYDGRTYYRCDCYTESYTHFTDIHGDIDCGTGGKYIHLYYTKEISANSHDAITAITADTNSSGAVINTSGDTQSVETGDNHSDDYYLHTTLADPTVSYIDTNGTIKSANAETLTASTNTLLGGWYAVTEDVVNNNRLTCSGNVNLILCDGATLTAHKGITVSSGNSLTIWQQNNGTGALTIDNCTGQNAGIGGGSGQNAGTITINGGVINVIGGMSASGIGGGFAANASVITINGGTVNTNGGVGIGAYGSEYASGGSITINGGIVRATGEHYGIGSDYENVPSSCTVTLNYSDRTQKNMSVYVTAEHDNPPFNADVTFSKSFYDKASMTEYSAGYFSNTDSLNGKTLIPNVNGWDVLQQQINDAESGDTIKLGGYNYSAKSGDSALVIPEGKTVTLDLNGYTINRNLSAAAENGNAITNNGTLTLTGGGKIIGANNTSNGGAVLNNGTLTIENAELSGNTAYKGGGVYNSSGAVLIINGGSIKNNTTNQYHGGGICNYGTVTINDGTISYNSTHQGGNGGGIFNESVLNINGGTIKNNTCRSNGGGIYFSAGSINISGSPVITGNKNSDNNDNNVDLSDKKITVSGTLSESTKIGITGAGAGEVITQGLSGKGSVQNFFCDYSGYLICANSDGEAIVVNTHTITITEQGNGTTSVDAENNKAAAGDTVTVTAEPQAGCYVELISYKRNNYEGVTIHTGTEDNLNQTVNAQFTMPDGSVEVTVAYKQKPINYVDVDGSEQILTEYTLVNSTMQSMSTGWYVVSGDIVNNNRIAVSGDVNLLLCDSSQYSSVGGFKVESGNSLTIWQQENGTGRLVIDASSSGSSGNACIGSNSGSPFYSVPYGDITINGGILNLTAKSNNPAIGCGSALSGSPGNGTITINGGTITATGGSGSAAIGCGSNTSGGSIVINGGNVTAHGSIGGSGADITLSWTNRSDSIYADSYSGTVTLSKAFRDENDNKYEEGAVVNNSPLANKNLTPYFALEKTEAKSADIFTEGNIEYYTDNDSKFYKKESGLYTEITQEQTVIPALINQTITPDSENDVIAAQNPEIASEGYIGARFLGFQKKALTHEETKSNSLRFITEVSSEILEKLNSDDDFDYGFIFAAVNENGTANYNNLTVDSNKAHIYSCKNTTNTVSGEFGNTDFNSTDYKYITAAVNDIPNNVKFVARFYITYKNGETRYADYGTSGATGVVFNTSTYL